MKNVPTPDGVEIKESSIPGVGKGAFAAKLFPLGSKFGPYQGDIINKHKEGKSSGKCGQVSYVSLISIFLKTEWSPMSVVKLNNRGIRSPRQERHKEIF